MNIPAYLSQLAIEGDLVFSSPHGSVRLKASKADHEVKLHFENGSTFRYFLSTVQPYSSFSRQSDLVKYLKHLPQPLSVTLGNEELLSSGGNGVVKVNYLKAGLQWLRFRLSRLF